MSDVAERFRRIAMSIRAFTRAWREHYWPAPGSGSDYTHNLLFIAVADFFSFLGDPERSESDAEYDAGLSPDGCADVGQHRLKLIYVNATRIVRACFARLLRHEGTGFDAENYWTDPLPTRIDLAESERRPEDTLPDGGLAELEAMERQAAALEEEAAWIDGGRWDRRKASKPHAAVAASRADVAEFRDRHRKDTRFVAALERSGVVVITPIPGMTRQSMVRWRDPSEHAGFLRFLQSKRLGLKLKRRR